MAELISSLGSLGKMSLKDCSECKDPFSFDFFVFLHLKILHHPHKYPIQSENLILFYFISLVSFFTAVKDKADISLSHVMS